jgi:putative ABC transport system permease protein
MNNLLQTLLEESHSAVRALWRNPGFTLPVLGLLTITIGAVTSLGAAAYELLNGPLPYGRSNELAMVWSDLPKSGYSRAPLSGPELFDLKERSRSFTGFAAISATTRTLGSAQDPLQITIGNVTHNFFSVLQSAPQFGRAFTANDEGAGKPPTVILSWSLWQNRFGGDPSIVGRKIPLNGIETEVIGVMPAHFRMEFAPDANILTKTEAWAPFGDDLKARNREHYFLRVVGRLQENTTAETASKEVADIGASIEREFANYSTSGRRMFVVGLDADLAKPVRVSALALGFAGLFLVLLCFVNISGLWVARAIDRRHEHSIRQILGASVTRIRNQMILQSLMLSILGCALGIGAGQFGLVWLRRIRPPSLARLDYATLTWPTILGVVAIAVASTLFLIVVIWYSVASLDASSVARTRVSSAPRYRLRAALVAVQVGLALAFLVGSALWTRAFLKVLQTDLGFRPENALTFRYSINMLGLNNEPQVGSINQRLNEAVSSIPGVESAGSISHMPFDRLPNWSLGYWPEGGENNSREADFRPVSPGWLNAIGARVNAGRFFQDTDNLNSPKVIVVDRMLANRTWPGADPIGKIMMVQVWAGYPAIKFTVIGVLDHVRYRTIESQVREQMYASVRQFPFLGPYSLIVRSSLDLNALGPSIRQKVREVDSRIPIWDMRPLRNYYEDAAAERSFAAILLASFAGAALLLASIGVYSLLSYIVAGRQAEFGVRMALGASGQQIVRSVLKESLTWAIIGAAVSGMLFFPLSAKLTDALYGITPHDPLSWVLSAVALMAVIIIASWIPAFRASRVDPSELMRNQ